MTFCPKQDVSSNYHSGPRNKIGETSGYLEQPPSNEQQSETVIRRIQSFEPSQMAVFSPTQNLGNGLATIDSYHLSGQFGSCDGASVKSTQHFQGDFGMLGAYPQDWMPDNYSFNMGESRATPWSTPVSQPVFTTTSFANDDMISLGKHTFNNLESDPPRQSLYDPYFKHQEDSHDFNINDSFNPICHRQSPSSLATTTAPASLDDHNSTLVAPDPTTKAIPYEDFATSLSTNNFDTQNWPKTRAKRWKSAGSSRGSLRGTPYTGEALQRRRATDSQASTPSQIGSPSLKQLHSTPSSRASLAVPFTPPNSLEGETNILGGPLIVEPLNLPLQFDFGSEPAFFGIGGLQNFMTPPMTASQYRDTSEQDSEHVSFPKTLYPVIEKGPDLFASAREEVSDPPIEDLCPADEELRPHQQDLRFDGDLYTPRWVRGSGHKREGWCGMCKPGKWLILKNSAFWYDKCFAHGICPPTGQRFAEPAQFRRSSDNPDIWEGFCGECNQWITLVSSKRKGTSWFRHVAKCHSNDRVREGQKKRKMSGHLRTASTPTLPKPSLVVNQEKPPLMRSTTATANISNNNGSSNEKHLRPPAARSISMPSSMWPEWLGQTHAPDFERLG